MGNLLVMNKLMAKYDIITFQDFVVEQQKLTPVLNKLIRMVCNNIAYIDFTLIIMLSSIDVFRIVLSINFGYRPTITWRRNALVGEQSLSLDTTLDC